jgi:hypothetical protein
MAITTSTGLLDLSLGYVVPQNNGTWAATSGTSWDSFTSWTAVPISPLVWVSNPVDAGSLNYWNVKLEATFYGDLSKYEIYISTTGAFAGEETTYTVNNGDTNIPAFYGQYFRVAAFVYNTGGDLALLNLSITASNNKLDLTFSDVATSSLPTWTSIDTTATVAQARVLDLGRKVSSVASVTITPNYVTTGSSGYSIPGDNFQYFEQFDYGQVTIPSIVRKRIVTTSTSVASGCGTAFILQNQNGDLVNGTVDVRVQAYPEQYMSGGQLLTR